MKKISLRAARVNAGYSLEKASAVLGISPLTLARYEMGESEIKATVYESLCELYGYPLDTVIAIPERKGGQPAEA